MTIIFVWNFSILKYLVIQFSILLKFWQKWDMAEFASFLKCVKLYLKTVIVTMKITLKSVKLSFSFELAPGFTWCEQSHYGDFRCLKIVSFSLDPRHERCNFSIILCLGNKKEKDITRKLGTNSCRWAPFIHNTNSCVPEVFWDQSDP